MLLPFKKIPKRKLSAAAFGIIIISTSSFFDITDLSPVESFVFIKADLLPYKKSESGIYYIYADISYVPRFSINETQIVQARISASENLAKLKNLPRKLSEIVFTLNCAGLTVNPSEPIKITPLTNLPYTFVWTVSTEHAAGHSCSISNNLPTYGTSSIFYNKLTINGVDKPISDIRNITLPLAVTTVWGLDEVSFEYVKLGITLLGFLLTLPLLGELLKIIRRNPVDSRDKGKKTDINNSTQ